MRLNQSRERSPGNHHVHLGQEALSPSLLVVTVKAKAGEAFLPHKGPAQRVNDQGKQNQKISDKPRGKMNESGVP
jgi:hypothetical protein